jgi:exopolysaccharide production protein ExoZ
VGQADVRTLSSIQYLRGVAAVAVVSYHIGQYLLWPVEVGAAGVDVFFIISGFVMWTTTWQRPTPPLLFLWRRAIRVAPLYWLATLALLACVLAVPSAFFNITVDAGHILKSLAFISHVNPLGAPFPFLAPGWTLNYEAIFYLAFALSLCIPPSRRLAVLAGLLIGIACLGWIDVPRYRLGANPMMLQFLAGALIGRLWLQRMMPGARAGWILMGASLLMFFGSVLLGVKTDFFVRPMLWGIPAATLVLGALTLDANGALPRAPVLQRLGDASYSIYLCHVIVLALFNRAIGPTNPILFLALGMALSVGAGLFCHRYVERPLLKLMRRRLPGARSVGSRAPGAAVSRS